MRNSIYIFAILMVLATATAMGQQPAPSTPTPLIVPAGITPHTTALTQAQIAACQAALPPEPKAPKPPGKSMFTKLDGVLKKGGIDPDAMRAQAYQTEKDKYDAAEQAYQKQKNACSAPVIAPVATEQASATPVTPTQARPATPAPATSKPILSADGRHLFTCPKNASNAPEGILACVTPDGTYVPLQEVPIPPSALPPPVASQPAAKKVK